METFWFIILVVMLTLYVVLDGFDLGVGIIHLLVAKTNSERKTTLNAIGPLWDGNEVWLIGAGGVLYMAFPKMYASTFSGFYLPLMIVLWLLMLRALAIEFRRHIENEMWQSLWDVVFSLSSLGLTILFGAALGNILRGVSLNESGFFFAPLWTDFGVSGAVGIVDWYTILISAIAVAALAVHGALFLAYKTEGDVYHRSKHLAQRLWPVAALISVIALVATCWIRPGYLDKFVSHPWGFVFPLVAGIGLILVIVFARRGRDGLAFVSSCLFIAVAGAATAFSLYPVLLLSTNEVADLTVTNSSSASYGLEIASRWFWIGFPPVVIYFIFLYYTFRGKVSSQRREHY
ncbi:MAG: cytochrome d ubiquinol oxidase subunit II [Leptospirales bacterium]|nr:cytochrome d ubiquinol oxidase subunit II [Leptospirales bacterium]